MVRKMNKEKAKECKERGYHIFNDKDGKLIGLDFVNDNYEEAIIQLVCQVCGAEAELQGDFDIDE